MKHVGSVVLDELNNVLFETSEKAHEREERVVVTSQHDIITVVRTGDRNTITSIECCKADRSTMDFILNT